MHPDTELRRVSDAIGYGVFATRRIPRGTITWSRCLLDRGFRAEDLRAFPQDYAEHLEKYGYRDRDGALVLCWDYARFMNHACAPACVSPGFDFDVAVRDIERGDELTCDYGMLNLTEPFDCACARPGCRGTIAPTDWSVMTARWDALVRDVFAQVTQVAQPLRAFVTAWDDVARAAADPTTVPSCARHRWTPEAAR